MALVVLIGIGSL